MTVRTRLPLVIAVLGMLVVSGCTTTSPGTPVPGSSTGSSAGAASDLPSDGAPKVEDPLDVSQFEQNPCEVLKPEDAEELNIPATGEQGNSGAGETCAWRNSQTRGSLSIGFFSEDKRGLSSVYQEAKKVNWPYFERIDDIEGHPAVAFSPSQADPSVDCSVVVGVTDQLVFTVRVALSDASIGNKDPCEMTAKAARMMMNTMREAA